MEIQVGDVIGRYRVEAILGSGGMGTVAACRDPELKRIVAVKVLKIEPTPEVRARFVREIKVMVKLNHPGIVRLLDYQVEEDPIYLVMPVYPGQSLDRTLHSLRASSARPRYHIDPAFRKIALQLAESLAAIHPLGILHRDIKPGNVLVRLEPVETTLMDFGIAWLAEAPALTEDGIVVGTPGYLSPEQLLGEALTPASDIYQLGLIYFHMFTGFQSIPTRDLDQLIARRLTGQILHPRDVDPGFPEALADLIMRCLERDPSDRYEASQLAGAWRLLDPLGGRPRGRTGAGATGRPVARSGPGERIGEDVTPATAGLEPADAPGSGGAIGSRVESGPRSPSRTLRRTWSGLSVAIAAGLGASLLLVVALGVRGPPRSSGGLQVGEPSAADAVAQTPASVGTSQGRPGLLSSIHQVPDRIRGADGASMILVPEGTFVMGSTLIPEEETRPHTVTVRAFYLDQYEVTNRLFERLLEERPGSTPGSRETVGNRPDHPATGMSWDQAAAYCRRWMKRLPREAEWERASRYPDGRSFPWGHDRSNAHRRANVKIAWKSGSGPFDGTQPVGAYPAGASELGFHDLVGNVLEWCEDFYDERYYRSSPVDDPRGPRTGLNRVLRGGSYRDALSKATSYYRFNRPPWKSFRYVGFRCACDVETVVKPAGRTNRRERTSQAGPAQPDGP